LALSSATSSAKARERAAEIAPQIAEARAEGCVSLRAIAAYLNERSITTPGGKLWTATAVSKAEKLIPA
jgi:hypothetical protein